MNTSLESGRGRIVSACRKAISSTEGKKVRLLLENSADANSVGARFEVIRDVLHEVDDKKRTGVCLDTCHAFASGYDLRNEKSVEETMETFDDTIGLSRLFVIHLNDSKGTLGGTSDRHEDIGKGQIASNGMAAILNSSHLNNIPVILETPRDYEGEDRENIARVKKLII